MRHPLTIRAIAFLVVLGCCSLSQAQWYNTQRRNTSLRNQAGFRPYTQQILNRPTVSPYLALTDLTGSGQIDTSRNYFTQVRPALEFRQQQQQQQRSLVQVQQQVTQLRSSVARQSQQGPRGTGHPTRFNFLLQYYPGMPRR